MPVPPILRGIVGIDAGHGNFYQYRATVRHQTQPMIVRIWRGRAPLGAKADAYRAHVTGTVFPQLKALVGHQGAWLLRREIDGEVEFLAMTIWDSLDSIRSFTGEDIGAAIVEPEARAVLSDFDDFARHYDVAFKT